MYGLVRSPDKSLLVVCGGAVVVVAACNAAAVNDVVAVVGVAVADGVAVAVGAAAALVFWVQQCWMRPCTSLQSHFVSVVVTLRGNEPSWWYRQTTQDPPFNNGEAGVFSTMVLIAGTTLACAVFPCGSVVVMVGITLAGVINPCGS